MPEPTQVSPTGKTMRTNRLYIFALTLTLAACGGGQSAETPAAATTAESTAPPPTAVPEALAGDAQEVVIRPVGETMAFETTEFTVKAGSKVTLTFVNVATTAAMQHNVVILAPDADINAIGTAGMSAGPAKNYVPEDPGVLFFTEIAMPGETKSVEFTAPAPGEYPFICTFPGHFMVMRGIMKSVA